MVNNMFKKGHYYKYKYDDIIIVITDVKKGVDYVSCKIIYKIFAGQSSIELKRNYTLFKEITKEEVQLFLLKNSI